ELSREPACDRIQMPSRTGRDVGRAAIGVFRLDGEYWTVEFEGQVARLRDSKGLQYLAHLLHHPGQRVPASTLQALAATATGPSPSAPTGPLAERARLAVTKRLKSALEHIGAALPSLGRHLHGTLHRGYFCFYAPDPPHLVAVTSRPTSIVTF